MKKNRQESLVDIGAPTTSISWSSPALQPFSSHRLRTKVSKIEQGKRQLDLPSRCFSLIFSAAASFERCSSVPLSWFPFFCLTGDDEVSYYVRLRADHLIGDTYRSSLLLEVGLTGLLTLITAGHRYGASLDGYVWCVA